MLVLLDRIVCNPPGVESREKIYKYVNYLARNYGDLPLEWAPEL